MQNRNGFALMATLLVMLLTSAVIAVAVTGATSSIRASNLDHRNSRVFYAAEAGAEAIMAQLEDALDDGVLDGDELASVTAPQLSGFTFGAFSVRKVGGVGIETITDGPFAGLYSLTQRVEIYSEVTDPIDNTSAVVVSAKAQAIPIFQFGIFYEKDLEIHNGPPMEFGGWVHTNGNLYLQSNNAWYRDVITTPNKMFNDHKDTHYNQNGVFIDDAVGNEVRLTFDSRSLPNPNDFRNQSNIDFDNRLKTDAYGVDSLRVPLPNGVSAVEVIEPRKGSDGPLERQAKYAWKADWYIELDLNALAGGGPCPAMAHTRAGQAIPSAAECSNIFKGSWETFYEGRQQQFADALTIDLGALFNWTTANPGGKTQILYVTFKGVGQDPSGDGVYPVLRLKNGANLGNPITIATDRPVYIQGDFNTISWVPAAAAGDAITILSNSWTDAAHIGPGLTTPTNTEVNVAILMGHTATPWDHEVTGTNAPYGGGLENYLRFLENWGTNSSNLKKVTYRGSLVSLHESVYATAPWSYGIYYYPPQRDWAFDTRFEDPANLPPGTPTVGNVIQTAFRPGF